MPTVTALRPRGSSIGVDLDGERWRTLPADVVVRAGLRIGCDLDRAALRQLGRELRRHRALAIAGRALRHRDLSRGDLEARLERAAVAPAARTEALATAERAGLVDDERFARERALSLAKRGLGDAAIREDLAERAVPPEALSAALAALPPEIERAAAIAARRGQSPRTARYLAGRGFEAESISGALPSIADDT